MSDSALNYFLAKGTTAARTAFTPSPPTPASGPSVLYLWYDTDLSAIYYWTGAAWAVTGGSGTVTNTGTLTDHGVIIGNGGADISATAVGTDNTVLHGNTGADPTFSAVVEADITLADNTTNNVTSTKHGFGPKSPGDTSKYLDGGATPAWSQPYPYLSGQKFNTFVISIKNNAGTLQHAIWDNPVAGAASAYVDKVTGAATAFNNTPTVGVGTDFTAGAGITGAIIVLNTADQDTTTYAVFVNVEYYDGNVATPRAYAAFTSRNVNGTTRDRLEITLQNALSGAAFTINTTNIPAGKQVIVRVWGFLV